MTMHDKPPIVKVVIVIVMMAAVMSLAAEHPLLAFFTVLALIGMCAWLMRIIHTRDD